MDTGKENIIEAERNWWLDLPEEERNKLVAFVMGDEVELSDIEIGKLTRYLDWNLAELAKLQKDEILEGSGAFGFKELVESQQDFFGRARNKLEQKLLKDNLKKEGEI